MAGKPLNRLDLRRPPEAAEPLDPMEDETDDKSSEELDDEEVVEKSRKRGRRQHTQVEGKIHSRSAKKSRRHECVSFGLC